MKEFGARIRNLPGDMRVCLGFFSRLPAGQGEARLDFSTSAAGWPLAGLVIVAIPAFILWIAVLLGFPAMVAAAAAIASTAVISGCLHEDGFADTADGFGGGNSGQRKLEIMHDSQLGTYGVIALVFNILLRVSALSVIIAGGAGVPALFATAMISRSIALWHWFTLTPAREDGLAASAGQPDELAFAIGSSLGFAVLFVLLIMLGAKSVFAVFLAALAVYLFTRLTRAQIGGHTGDTIGAAQQVAEIAILVGLAAGSNYSPLSGL